jgi:hypothetical protein
MGEIAGGAMNVGDRVRVVRISDENLKGCQGMVGTIGMIVTMPIEDDSQAMAEFFQVNFDPPGPYGITSFYPFRSEELEPLA